MSRIGKKLIEIPKDVTVTVDGNVVKVKGPKGELNTTIHPNIKIEMNGSEIELKRSNDLKLNRALHGLSRALIQNMILGVSQEFKKALDIVGVGYKVELKGSNLLLNMGYSHPIYFIPPAGIKIEAPIPTQIIVSGIDKQLVGQVAAKIRSIRKPEPYKGKGIKYSNEQILRKAGKTAGK